MGQKHPKTLKMTTKQKHHNETQMLTPPFPLNEIVDEILVIILSHLPALEILLTCRLVSHKWKQLSESQVLWHDKCLRDGFWTDSLTHPDDFRSVYFQSIPPFCNNLVKNPHAADGLDSWDIVANGGDEFHIESSPAGADPIEDYAKVTVPCWVTSFQLCEKEQRIDLIAAGCHTFILDTVQPDITISEWYSCRFDCGGKYSIWITLHTADDTVLDQFFFKDIPEERSVWHQVTHTFCGFGSGLRYIKYRHGGVDTQFWAGHYGPKFTLSTVKLVLPPKFPANSLPYLEL